VLFRVVYTVGAAHYTTLMVKHKRIQHCHEPGDVHELTFSCYHHMPLLTNDVWRGYLAESIDTACRNQSFRLAAFVFMPEHVHLLTLPESPEPDLGYFIAALKRPVSAKIKGDLATSKSPLLDRLTIREREGKSVFRYWQEGPGYDRNLQREASALAAIDYIHSNPVRRGLCHCATEWFWSSARFYTTEPPLQDPRLPRITPLPAELLD
jgi:putative transposase